jgi:hypothetical protein
LGHFFPVFDNLGHRWFAKLIQNQAYVIRNKKKPSENEQQE